MERREFLRLGALAGAVGVGTSVVPRAASASEMLTSPALADRVKRGGILTVAEPDDPGTVDFLTSTLDVLRHSIRAAVLDTLVHASPNLKITPGAAASWTVSSDAKTVTFNLRPNLRFHDGSRCTSVDVAYTVSWLKNPKNGSPLSVLVANIETVQAVSPTIARFRLSSPTPGLLANLTQVPIFSAGTVKTMKTHPIGLGPFMFQSYKPGESLSVVKNPHYYERGLPYLDGITWQFITDPQASLEDLASGSVMMVDSLAVQNAQNVKSGQNTKLITSAPVNLYEVFQINTKKAPFSDKRVRQALSYAMDRKSYVKAFWGGLGVPSDTAFVSEMPSYLRNSATHYKFNLKKAEELLKRAGFTRSHPLSMDILTPTGFPTLQAMALALQSGLKSIGHQVTVTNMAVAPWIDRIVTHPNFDVTTDNYNTLPVDPGAILTTSNLDPSNNVNQFGPPEYARLVQRAASEPNAAKRTALYHEIQAYLLDEQPCVVVDHYPVIIGANKTVKGLEITPVGPYDYSRVTIR